MILASLSVFQNIVTKRENQIEICVPSVCFHCKGLNLLFFIFFLLICWIDTNRHCVVSGFVLRTGV